MTSSDCNHFELTYLPIKLDKYDVEIPGYKCSSCRQNLYSKYFGGTLDTSEYTANVVAYNGLKLERTKPKSQLELKLE
jgi:transposase-like protein